MAELSPFPCGKTRREFFWQMGNGFFGTALTYMLAGDGVLQAAPTPAPSRDPAPHFPAKAKACIFLYMVGGPSHVDTFDPKPELARRDGENVREAGGRAMGSPFQFLPSGQSGIEVSELFPRLRQRVDDMAIIRGTYTDSNAHGSATMQMNTGYIRQGFPSLGSWMTYGLGSVNQNLPGFVVLVDGAPYAGALNWASGFMPAAYQGTVFNTSAEPVANLRAASRASLDEQRARLDLLNAFNQGHRAPTPQHGELAARIESYELAYRMQATAPETADTSRESDAVRRMYGIDESPSDRFGRSCLLARRLVERGVRFVQLYHSNWDTHGGNNERHRQLCAQTDKPIAGLLADLKARGLLDETIVVWAGEFGRTPAGNGGRDHHSRAFSTWMAGGGVKGGVVHGETDPFGYQVVNQRVHVHDLHATILNRMGLDHERLTYRHTGRDFRLTDVHGRAIEEILQ
jgi:hypothetical protein